MSKLHPVIQEIKTRASAINYGNVAVNDLGQLTERVNLLDQRIVEGYGFIWGSKNTYNERFHKGAFARSIKENGPGSGAAYEIKFRDEHGRAMGLFDELVEDEIGLYFRTKPLDAVSWADDCLTQMRSGTVNNFSGGFTYVFEAGSLKWNESEELIDVFHARLLEISAVSIPSDMQTFRLRSAESDESLFDETEQFIKSLPQRLQLEARHLIARHKAQDGEESLDRKFMKALKTEKPPIEVRGINLSNIIKNL